MSVNEDRHGFSLVELIMVMLLMGIMAGIVVPLLRPEKFQMDAAVVVIGSSFTAQQRNAVLRQHNIVMAIDTVAGTIRVHYDADNDDKLDNDESWHVIQLEDGVEFGRGAAPARPFSSLSISFTEEQDDMPALTFRRNGSAGEESIVYLTSARASSSLYPEDSRAVEIERATGRVRCYSYASGAWLQTC